MELAAAYVDFSDFQAEVAGNVAAGLDYCMKAIAILDHEATAEPHDFRVITEDMDAYLSLGMLHLGNGAAGSIGTVSRGAKALERALVLYQSAIQMEPLNVSVRQRGATIGALLGDAMLKLGDRPRSLDYFRRSLDSLNLINATAQNIVAQVNEVFRDQQNRRSVFD